ncbi:glycoside hydrolase family 2 TIM barrel-domain containing protein [Roseateles sp. BYS96W]|uniref:Glycoside hydrolase family 2 TIM barrel-domain containing protein n=1 Tax=Pelomonas nitida TaxID=3299027 RepID=A0ABW7G940_9BURK
MNLPVTRFTLLAAGLALALVASTVLAQRQEQTLDSGWRFSKTDPGAAMQPAFDDSAWQVVRVPHDWSQHEPFRAEYGSGNGYAAGGIAWYRRSFAVGPEQAGRVARISFDGVYDHAQVWINGHYVGGRPYGYSSFEFELTRHLKTDGSPNVLAVRVDHSRQMDSRYFTGSGIYRDARLSFTDALHIAPWGTYVTTPDVSAAKADVRAQAELVNAAPTARAFTLRAELLAPGGRVVATRDTPTRLAAGERRALTQNLVVTQPQRWSLDAPQLYTLRQTVLLDGKAVDQTDTPFGIRSFRFDANAGFTLNGLPLKLKGVCLHHDAGSLGAAVPVSVLERRLQQLKDIGVNAIRTSHNPPAPELLDLADRMGFLVQAEAFDEFTPTKNKWIAGWNVGVPGRQGYGEEFAQWSVRDVEDMVRRDRNHPSIVMWSVGNEVDYPNDPFSHPVLGAKYRPTAPPASDLVRWGRPLVDAVRRMDPTRPVTAAMASVEMSDAVGFGQLFDVAGYNYQEARYTADHAKFPQRVIYGSENRHDYRAWAVVRDTPYISAQFLWTGFDYLGEAHQWPQRGADFGLFDLAGFMKPRGAFRASLWSAKPVVYLAAATASATQVASQSGQGTPLLDQQKRAKVAEHWNWPAGERMVVSAYANTPDVQLWLNGRLVGTQKATDAVEGILSWTLPFEAGELKAVGLKDGQPVAEFKLETAGAPARIALDRVASGRDGVEQIAFFVVDAQGRRVPDAAHQLHFEPIGPLEILGIGNGNLADVDDPRDAEHAVHEGRGLAILRRTATTPQPMRLRVTAPGLAAAELSL